MWVGQWWYLAACVVVPIHALPITVVLFNCLVACALQHPRAFANENLRDWTRQHVGYSFYLWCFANFDRRIANLRVHVPSSLNANFDRICLQPKGTTQINLIVLFVSLGGVCWISFPTSLNLANCWILWIVRHSGWITVGIPCLVPPFAHQALPATTNASVGLWLAVTYLWNPADRKKLISQEKD